ncbi:MAG: hypothetical protein ABI651_15060, partial [Verrucomicrobiota bacterium]
AGSLSLGERVEGEPISYCIDRAKFRPNQKPVSSPPAFAYSFPEHLERAYLEMNFRVRWMNL